MAMITAYILSGNGYVPWDDDENDDGENGSSIFPFIIDDVNLPLNR